MSILSVRRRRRGALPRRGTAPRRSAVPLQALRWAWPKLLLLGLLVGFALGAVRAGAWLADPQRFPLRYVHVQGELRQLDRAELLALVEPFREHSFFFIDIAGLNARLAAHPWVEQAGVRRQWPDALTLTLHERTALARWGKDEMIDAQGRRFRPARIPEPERWVRLHGPDGLERQVVEFYRHAQARLAALDLHVGRLTQDPRGAWRLRLTNGLTVDLGNSRIEPRLQRFIALYPDALRARLAEIATVDLRYPNGAALRWTELSAVADKAATPGKPQG